MILLKGTQDTSMWRCLTYSDITSTLSDEIIFNLLASILIARFIPFGGVRWLDV